MLQSTTESSPAVSVVIPTYRRAHLVTRAIQSVLNQTITDIEVIVVNDASPDNTEEAVRKVSDNRVHYMRHERNRGLAAAGRNSGMSVARGRYIAFLDDDDEWRTDKLERQLEAIKSHDAVLCGALVNGSRPKIHCSSSVTVDDLRRGNPFDPSGLLVKASVLRELRFDEELKWGEDWDMCIRLAQRYSVGYVQEPLVLYSDGDHQRITNDAKYQTGAELEKRAAVLKKHRGFFGEAWYKYYYAHTLLSYLGKRGSKIHCIGYAVQRCGVVSVARVIASKLWRYLLGLARTETLNTGA